MLIRYSFKNRILKIYFHIERELGDTCFFYSGKEETKIELIRPYCSFILPISFEEKHIQPNCIALMSLLIVFPFIGDRLFFGFTVSDKILKSIENLGIGCQATSTEFHYEFNNDKPLFPGIVYSGGVQSTASLLLLHKTSKIIFLDNVEPFKYISEKNIQENSNKDHIYYTLEHLIKEGYNVCIVRSDIKQMFKPKSIPFELAVGCPAILLSTLLNLDSIHYGYTRHHIQQLKKPIPFICTGEWKFCSKYFTPKNPSKLFQSYSKWNSVFKSCGLHFSLPVMGCTAVLTHRIIKKSKLNIPIISCENGTVDINCKKCVSCFIHIILEELHMNKIVDSHILDDLYTMMKPIMAKYKYNTTIKEMFKIPELEIFILYMAFAYKGTDSIMNEWKEALYNYKEFAPKIMHWSKQSVCFIHPKYRNIVRDNIIKYSK